MSNNVALSISIGVLGGIAAALCLGPLNLISIWAVFIGWACFFAIGGDNKALQNTIVCTILGAIIAWIGLVIFTGINLSDALSMPIWAGIVVAVTVFVLCLLANIEVFSSIPAGVLGYASVAAWALKTPGALDNVTAVTSGTGMYILIIISLVAGAVLGMISGKIAGAMSSS